MKAVQVSPARGVDVVDVPAPRIEQPGDALIKVALASVCGSDLRVPLTGVHRPGHEFIGTVVEVGPKVRRFRVGDRVIGACLVGCGTCSACLRQDTLACANEWRVYGEEPDLPGCQAEFVRVPGADLHLAPQGELADDIALLMTDSLPTGWLGANAANVAEGTDVVVLGLGPVGLCSVFCALRRGARRVFAVDPNPVRASLGRVLGATVLDATTPVAPQVRDLTSGKGAPSVIEAVGEPETVVAAVHSAAARGTVVVLGMVVLPEIAVPFHKIGARSLTLKGLVCSPTTTWPTLMPLALAHQESLGRILTHRLALADAPGVYEVLRTPTPSIVKVALRP